MDADLSEFEPIHFSLGFNNDVNVGPRRIETRKASVKKEFDEIPSSIWTSMDQLNITSPLPEPIRSDGLLHCDNTSHIPPQFSDKFLFEDEGMY